MSLRNSIAAAIVAVAALSTGVANAQSLPQDVSASVSTQAGALTPGEAGQTVATIMLSSTNTGGVYVYSVPVQIAATGGAAISDLNGCQVFDPNGVAVSNVTFQAGTNNLSLGSAGIRVAATSPMNLTVRCGLASTAPSQGTFQFTALPGTGTGSGTGSGSGSGTSTSTSPSLRVSTPAVTIPNIRAGAQDALLAVITLDAQQSNNDINVSSVLPVTVTTGNGALPSHLSGCAVRNVGSGAIISGNTAIPALVSGSNTFQLNDTTLVSRGAAVSLAITCDVSASTPVGGTFQIGTTPGSIAASSSGGSALVPTGTAAGTIVTVTSSSGPVIPGVPNTGAGGEALVNLLVLLAAVGGLFVGFYLLGRKRA